jgi:uncharacterized protein (TIGR00106 family)
MIVEFSIIPIGRGEELAGYVAEILDLVDGSGLPYKLTAMGTILEGDWDAVMPLIKACHEKMMAHGSRVLTRISIDDRRGASNRIDGKVADVEKILGRDLKK